MCKYLFKSLPHNYCIITGFSENTRKCEFEKTCSTDISSSQPLAIKYYLKKDTELCKSCGTHLKYNKFLADTGSIPIKNKDIDSINNKCINIAQGSNSHMCLCPVNTKQKAGDCLVTG